MEKNGSEKDLAVKLEALLNANANKRVIVVGTTCTGKSSFLKQIEGTHDMDDLVFPALSKEESDYVSKTPWTEEIGREMIRLTRERVSVKAGKPIFGTVVFDSDLIILLKISDDLLRERTKARGVNFEDAKNMQRQIEREIGKSKIPVIEFSIG